MVTRSLKSLYFGFAAIERQLLKMEHTGWVHYKQGNGELILLKSPYRATSHDEKAKYAVPLDLRPAENDLVTLEVEGPMRQLKGRMGDSCFCNFKDWYKVVGVIKHDINQIADIQKPYLNADDFRYRLSMKWKNAALDHLDFSLALQLLSCPEGIQGKGGIGTWSLAGIGSNRTPLRDLQKTIKQLLPTEFLNGNNRYQYAFINDKKTHQIVKRNRKDSSISEISYNHLWRLPPLSLETPINIPTYIYNSEYIPGPQELDQDALEYLLTALIIKPSIDDQMISKIERTVKQVYEKTYSDEDFAGLNMDCYSPLKIASAICRLDLKNKIDEDSFDRYGAIFNEIMYDFIEFKKDVVDSNPDRETWTVPNVEVSNQDNRLEYLDHQLLRIIRKVEEEQGKEWVSRMDIELHPTFDMKLRGDWKVDDSLRRLNNIGKIIKSPHGLGYKRLKLQ